MAYVDFILVPLRKGNEAEYIKICEKFASYMKVQGLLDYCEAVADDVPHGERTDFYRAVQAGEGETVVAAYCTWPDKVTRDKAWQTFMSDPSVHSGLELFDSKKMVYGGFKSIFNLKN